MLWLLEHDIFLDSGHPLTDAVARAGHRVVVWDDCAWSFQEFPPETDEPTLFHGSLGNADKIAALGRWTPGAYCNTAGFNCSKWYPQLQQWLVNQDYIFTTVRKFVEAPEGATAFLKAFLDGPEVFVRPNSPLKPFSGRVVTLTGLIAAHLDHGFYYEDLDLPIVVALKQDSLGQEWRFVVADGEVVASSAYVTEGRKAQEGDVPPDALRLATEICTSFTAPDRVYMLDLVETPKGIRLLEVNPFSGADLYRCDLDAVVAAVARGVT